MNRDEYLKRSKEAEERFKKMSPEEQEALLAAQRRHFRKVRDEIITSNRISERKEKEGKNSN